MEELILSFTVTKKCGQICMIYFINYMLTSQLWTSFCFEYYMNYLILLTG